MEFFQYIKKGSFDERRLRDAISIESLPRLCESITKVIENNINHGVIYCTWGQFNVRREEIRCGIRFSLVECPSALAWTITGADDLETITVHCTTNTEELDPDFFESIQQFMADWKRGLVKLLA